MKSSSTRAQYWYIKLIVALLIVTVVTFTVLLYERKILARHLDELPFVSTLSRLLNDETVYSRVDDVPLQPIVPTSLLVATNLTPNRELFPVTTQSDVILLGTESSDNALYIATENLVISEKILRLLSTITDSVYDQILKQADGVYESVDNRLDDEDDNTPSNSVLTITGSELEIGFITATSTNATSTFAHSISIASDAQYRIGGVGVLSRQSNGAILGGDLSGNARGNNAIDIQSFRGFPGQVASGAFASAFGAYNTASGNDASAFGSYNTASAFYSSAFGFFNTVSGNTASAFGAYNTVSANYASAFGSNITNNIANSTMIGPSDSAKLTILDSGETQANFFTATSTNATSTFAHSISIASDAQYRIGGVGVLSRQSNGAILGGDLSGNARGLNALDIQSNRSLLAHVASGDGASAFGVSNTASGYYASAVGNSNQANSSQSSAFGFQNTASTYFSTSAFGNQNTASGLYASSFGALNTASAAYASAFGHYNTVSASYASAFGSNIINNIANSTMIGPSDSAKLTILDSGETQANFFTATSTNATSTFAHSISIASDAQYRIGGVGVLSRQSNGAIIVGDLSGNARGLNALDIQSGRSNATQVASGDYSLAFGYLNTASASYSLAFGYRNTASDSASSAGGYFNTASANYASAFGYYNDASGNYASAFGASNTASGDYASAFGAGTLSSYNTASGYRAQSFGFSNNVTADEASAFGSNIINNIANSTMIGPSDSAKLTILGSGNVGIGTTTPSAQLTTTGSVRFATFGAGDLQTDANGNLLVSSDERLKEIVDEYQATSSVQQLLGITPIQYRWTLDSGFDTSRIYTGFSAQNVAEFIPEAVGEDSRGFLTLSERPIIATIVNAIKEIWSRLTQQQEQIDELREDNETLREELEQLKEELNINDNSNTSSVTDDMQQTDADEKSGTDSEQEVVSNSTDPEAFLMEETTEEPGASSEAGTEDEPNEVTETTDTES